LARLTPYQRQSLTFRDAQCIMNPKISQKA
jgi:hypothetical protein